MNLLDIAQKTGLAFKRVSTNHGGEYHGPCPKCGGTDRFHLWPQQGDHGTFWCRSCQLAGDAIEYLTKIEGLSFPAACKEIGKELPELSEYQAPKIKNSTAAVDFVPRTLAAPSNAWQEHAEKFVQWSHQQLLSNQQQLDYLAARGIGSSSIIKYRLGYNPGENGKDLYRAREAWGLETILNGDKKKKLWLPIGLTIPCYHGTTLRRIRIRIPADRRSEQFSLPYYLVPGSSMDTFITREDAKAYVIVEAELDAITIDHQAGDLVGAMAMGNSSAKPTDRAFAILSSCLHISNALDFDATTEPGKKNAGGIAALWWQKQFSECDRWPVPVGKDPGDAFKAGIDLKKWIADGLPPVLTLPPPQRQAPNICRQTPNIVAASSEHCEPQDINSGASVSASPPPAAGGGQGVVAKNVSVDGITYYITDDQAEYQRLVASGEIVFDFAEIKMVIASGVDQHQAALYLGFKKTFPGSRITSVAPWEQPSETTRDTYRGKFTK